MKYKYKIKITLLTAIALTAFGCGKSGIDDDPNEMVLRLVLGAKIASLDPGDIGDTTSSTVSSQINECLYQYHFLKRPYQAVPMLAEDMPEISDDGLIYTIRIKQGIYFANDKCFEGGKGRELVAEDFIYSWKRIANIKYMSRNWWLLDNRIVGLDEFRAYTDEECETEADVDYSRDVEGLQAPDDYTLVIKLKKPWPQIVYALAYHGTAAVAKETVDYYGEDIMSHPVGTGPFMLKTWQKGSYVELVRNPNYRVEYYPDEGEPDDAEAGYLDDAGKQIPFADRIVWTVIEETQPAWLLFMQGKTDASGIPKDNFSEVFTENRELTPKMQQMNLKLETYRDPSTYWIGFNMEDPILGNNKPLRQAIGHAIDRERYIELFSNNRSEVANGFVPPLMASYNPEVREKGFSTFDPDRAKTLLKEAEEIYGGELPELTLSLPGTDTYYRQFGQFFQRLFDAVGLDVEMEYMDWPTYLNKVNTKSAQMFSSGWIADYPDAENFLMLFYSPNVSPGANSFNYVNPEYDQLYKQIAVMPDSPERTELYQQMELMILEDYPAAFLVHGVGYVLCHEWYKNYKPNVFAYGLSKYRRIDLAKRADFPNLLKTIK